MRIHASLRSLTLALALAVGVVLAACSATPLPEPPNVAPPEPSRLFVEPQIYMALDGYRVRGLAGAVPAGATVFVTNLDRGDEPASVGAGDDGSFRVTIGALGGDIVRVRVEQDGVRSAPFDLVVPPGPDTPSAAPAPFAECLSVIPSYEAEAPAGGETLEVRIESRCGSSLRFEQLALRRPVEGLAVEAPATPFDLTPGARLDVIVRADAAPAQETELLLRIASPERELRAVTIRPR